MAFIDNRLVQGLTHITGDPPWPKTDYNQCMSVRSQGFIQFGTS